MTNKIYSSGMTPVNKQASRVISSGLHFAPTLKPGTEREQKEPFATRPLSAIPLNIRHLISFHFGRLVVIGYSTEPGRWVVRCACGTYSLRRTKAVTNPVNIADACRSCRAMLQIQRRDVSRRTGREVDIEELPGACTERPPLPPPLKHGPAYVSQRIGPPQERPKRVAPLHYTELASAEPTGPTAIELAMKGAKPLTRNR